MCPILTFWHAKLTEYHNRNGKNTKNTTKKNELSMHTKTNISLVFMKINIKIQKINIKNYMVFFS